MTDDELRAIGQQFIDRRRTLVLPMKTAEESLKTFHEEYDWMDPLRVGVYVTAKNELGAWVIDIPAMRKVCVNPIAFKQEPPEGSARINEPVVTGDADDRDTLADF